jgi:hypothetical protein
MGVPLGAHSVAEAPMVPLEGRWCLCGIKMAKFPVETGRVLGRLGRESKTNTIENRCRVREQLSVTIRAALPPKPCMAAQAFPSVCVLDTWPLGFWQCSGRFRWDLIPVLPSFGRYAILPPFQ